MRRFTMMKRDFVSEGGGAKRAMGGNHMVKHALKRGAIQHLRTFCVATVDFREGLHSIRLVNYL